MMCDQVLNPARSTTTCLQTGASRGALGHCQLMRIAITPSLGSTVPGARGQQNRPALAPAVVGLQAQLQLALHPGAAGGDVAAETRHAKAGGLQE